MTRDEQAALDTVMKFLDSYAESNVEGCMSVMATSKPILLLGTNENEILRTTEEVRTLLERDFASMTDISFGTHRNLHVEVVPGLSSVIIEFPISYRSEGDNVETLFRYALTLIKEGEAWKISSGMASVPFSAGTYSFPE